VARAWRLTRRKHQSTAFNGEGSARAGGRWNRRGTRVAYASDSRALTVLEYLVHVDPLNAPADLVFIECVFPDALVVKVESLGKLPADWKSYPTPISTQNLGTEWVKSGQSAVLSVPSTLVSGRNYLLNTQHRDFSQMTTGSVEDFVFDERLFKTK
jgi:RES domain-containing protein